MTSQIPLFDPPTPHTLMHSSTSSRILALALFFSCNFLISCSAKLDEHQASRAVLRAQKLYTHEVRKRAPQPTPARFQDTLSTQIDTLPTSSTPPTLTSDDFDLDTTRFATPEGLQRENIDAILALCTQLERHVLSPKDYPCEDFQNAIDRVQVSTQRLQNALDNADLDSAQREQLAQYLLLAPPENILQPDGTVSDQTLLSLLFPPTKATLSPVPQATILLESLHTKNTRLLNEMARVEILGHTIYQRFAWDMRSKHAARSWTTMSEHFAWQSALAKREEERTGEPQTSLHPDIPPKWPTSAQDAQDASLQWAMSLLRTLPVRDATKRLQPDGDQYTLLLQAHDLYRTLVAKGGFPALPKDLKIRKGRTSKHTPALRARLVAEGYDAPTPDDPTLFDAKLSDALAAFQEAHQLKPKGTLNAKTRAALQISANTKLRRVRHALSTWRTVVPRSNYYVYINIPDYHGEVWKDGQRVHRFRIVVGNAKGRRSESRRLPNATRPLNASIDRVVLNPYWNVPKRIFRSEIMNADLKEMEPDDRDDALRAKGFELMAKGSRSEWVRQPPGPGNALGQVKIIFPNPHETYLHDTPSKSLFKKPRRAYSHGCMRVHKPLDLARILLQNDDQYDRARFDDILMRRDNTHTFLRNKVPIHVEYITVRVDPKGVAHFLEDIYGHDPAQLAHSASP